METLGWLAIPASVRLRKLYVLDILLLVLTGIAEYVSFLFCSFLLSTVTCVSREIKPGCAEYTDERLKVGVFVSAVL